MVVKQHSSIWFVTWFTHFSIFIISTDGCYRFLVPVITLVPHNCPAVQYKLGAKVHQMKLYTYLINYFHRMCLLTIPGFSLVRIMCQLQLYHGF